MHDNMRLKQQNIIQKIVQAQQYQQNWQEYQVLTGNSRNRKRSVFSFLSRMFSGILTLKASTVFSFLPVLHMFTSMGQLLQDTQNKYDTTNTPFKSTRELDSLFEQTKKFSMDTYTDMVGKDDKSLGQYVTSLHSILNETDISGIKEMNIMDMPNVVETSNDKVKSLQRSITVSYTHLTLPTIYSV